MVVFEIAVSGQRSAIPTECCANSFSGVYSGGHCIQRPYFIVKRQSKEGTAIFYGFWLSQNLSKI
ncbi:MAG: hypothetical protein F6K25_13220 [Okeania sp. SIO2G4]|nr:hypothetical protein [Okeania sp. SIO2H7]NEQ91609.1 hypothetical protein [Okeania sp. SIO2G4]